MISNKMALLFLANVFRYLIERSQIWAGNMHVHKRHTNVTLDLNKHLFFSHLSPHFYSTASYIKSGVSGSGSGSDMILNHGVLFGILKIMY